MPDEKRCKTCKWWTRIERVERPDGDCELTRMEDYRPSHPTSLALSDYDGESGNGALMTAPDFGCIQWEARDA